MSNPVSIQLNGEAFELVQPCSVGALIEQLKINHGRVAVEINREIIPRSEHGNTLIQAEDVVEIIHAIGGG